MSDMRSNEEESAAPERRDAAILRTGGIYHHHGRSLPMDMLRGVAILLVLGRHFVIAPENAGHLQPLATAWATVGWAGVDLFFVLSGFLVSGLIFAEYQQRGAVDVRRFVIRRGFKIWPPYLAYVAVVAAWLGWQYGGNLSRVWSELWPNVFHVQNYFHTPRVHSWSLAVEEHFYLAVAVVFYLLLVQKPRRTARLAVSGSRMHSRPRGAPLRHLPALIIGGVAGLAALRHFAFVRAGPAELNLYATHLRFDGLLIGTLFAYWTHFQPAKLAWLRQRSGTVMITGVLLAAPTLTLSPEWSPWTAGLGLSAMYVGFALLMLGWLNVENVSSTWRRFFRSRVAALTGQVGFYSYSIYLWHVDLMQTPVKAVLQRAGTMDLSPGWVWLAATTLYVIGALLIGALLARGLEMPSLALRDRLFPGAVKPAGWSAANTALLDARCANASADGIPGSAAPATATR